MEHVRGAAAQQVQCLLGQILARRIEQIQVTGAQGIAGVIVAVCGQEHLRGCIFI